MPAIVVLTSAPNIAVAKRLATTLVRSKRAACVSVIDNMRSVYRWKNKIHTENESLLVIKTTGAKLNTLKKTILANHPYQIPEIIALPVSATTPEYFKWIVDAVKS